MRITWKGGVSIEYKNVNVMLDPQNNGFNCSAAFISHAHLDHSKAFEIAYLPKFSSEETMKLASTYDLEVEKWQPLELNRKVAIDDVEVIPRNSGHVLGSYEFEVNTSEGNILFTGDLNTEYTKTMNPAEPVPCDILILESTFGSPYFKFPSEELVAKEMIEWAEKILKAGKIPVFQTDPLGNAQEVIRIFNEATSIPIVTHWRVTRINRIYESYGYKLTYFDARSDEANEITATGDTILITPKNSSLPNSEEYVPALVSGWALWSRCEAFPLSDHADFPHLISFVEECNPKMVLTCHGGRFNETFARYIERELKIKAYPIHLIPTRLSKT